MTLISCPDVGPRNAANPLSTITGAPKKCKWFTFALVNNPTGRPARVGYGPDGINLLAGLPVYLGAPVTFPPIALGMEFYDLTQIWYVVPQGDTGSLTCAV